MGHNALIVPDYDQPVNVTGYNPAGPTAKDLRTVTAALAYDDPATGETVILVVHQTIYIPEISHNLLSTLQVRLNDVTVNKCPRFLTDNITDLTHSIVIPVEGSETPYVIPLALSGMASSFPTGKPTVAEYESLPHLSLTSDEPMYNPYDTTFAQQEEALQKDLFATGDRIGAPPPSRRLCSVANQQISPGVFDGPSLSLLRTTPTLDICSLTRSLSSGISALCTTQPGRQFEAPILARNWGIDLQTAKRTVEVTTQQGVQTVLHPTLSRCFRTNDRQLQYRRLQIDCFTDTLISNTTSRRNNKYAQIFATSDGWCRAYPLAKKSHAYEGLSLLFQREGVPNTMVMDGAREQTMGMFRKKCRQVRVRVRQTEPHTPWSNAAEAAIRELKQGVGRQMVRSAAPKRLWEDCLEREAYVRSRTAHDIYRLKGQVPETTVSGETADIPC